MRLTFARLARTLLLSGHTSAGMAATTSHWAPAARSAGCALLSRGQGLRAGAAPRPAAAAAALLLAPSQPAPAPWGLPATACGAFCSAAAAVAPVGRARRRSRLLPRAAAAAEAERSGVASSSGSSSSPLPGSGADSSGGPGGGAPAAAPSAAAAGEEDEFPTVQLALPPPANVRIKTADFVKSSVELSQCPKEGPPEFAVIGRSNVGKSSLINMLTGRKSLAQVSKEPGKTQCINHFIINDSWYLVDLPGYGYAKRSKGQRREFDAFTRAYLKGRRALAMVLLLVDASIPPQAVDLDYAAWLASAGVPFSIVFTKADKRKKGAPGAGGNVAAFKRALMEGKGFPLVPPSVVTSAAAGEGKAELLAFIASLRVLWEENARAR